MNTKTENAIKAAFEEHAYYWDIEDDLFQVPNDYAFTKEELKEYAIAHKLPMISTQEFINDINDFIKNHAFMKQYDTEAEEDDHSNLVIPTVDGEYEQVAINYMLE